MIQIGRRLRRIERPRGGARVARDLQECAWLGGSERPRRRASIDGVTRRRPRHRHDEAVANGQVCQLAEERATAWIGVSRVDPAPTDVGVPDLRHREAGGTIDILEPDCRAVAVGLARPEQGASVNRAGALLNSGQRAVRPYPHPVEREGALDIQIAVQNGPDAYVSVVDARIVSGRRADLDEARKYQCVSRRSDEFGKYDQALRVRDGWNRHGEVPRGSPG